MSVAIPTQWSLELGSLHFLMHPIDLTLPGNASMIALAPLMATFLHPELVLGSVGLLPPPLPAGMQHLKSEGPGHSFDSVLPELHDDVKRQLPLLPVPQVVLVQHLMSSGVPGHLFATDVPPALEQFDVEMQTPGAPPDPVQAPFTSARGDRRDALAAAKKSQRTSKGRSIWDNISMG
ncbi:hypothetical protein ABEF95_010046 [Exophiala dermatitidis]